ncbi:MAG: hypothetical protein DRG11_07170 [Epsilonproteobacteria bacterium]|nr:MAG: hypothetical protein DRG11_07170 [Campylobacterota bacterium]
MQFDEKWVFKEKEISNTISELSYCVEPLINSLSSKYKDILYLSIIKELKQKEIALKLDISYSSVKNLVYRGKKELKEKFFLCCSYKYDSLGYIVEFESKDKDCNLCKV